MRHKVYMMMHHKEFGRGSNTGKLAVRTAITAPLDAPAHASGASAGAHADADTDAAAAAAITSTSAIIHTDIELQSRALLDLCEREPLTTVVLFPSKESITIEEFVALRGWSLPPPRPEYLATATATAQAQSGAGAAAAAPAAASSDPASPSPSPSPSLPPCPPLNIILLDGTWRQARGMRHLLPSHIPAIRIDPFKYRLDGTLREKRVVDVRAAAEMAAADGESDSLCVEDGTEDAAAAAAEGEEEAKEAAAASAQSPEAGLAASASPAAAATPGPTEKRAKKAKLSQRDAVHRQGKKAPQGVSSGSSGSGNGGAPAATFVSLFYPLRKQSQPDRISTVEALVILLMELHEAPAVTHALLDLLRVLVDSMRVQCGMVGVYGTYSEEQGRAMRIDVAMARAKRTALAKEAAAAAAAAATAAAATAAAAAPSDGSAATPAASGSSSGVAPAAYMSRKQRSRRANAFKPCMQWNRGAAAPCTATPCRYAHCCMLCNDAGHRAVECSLAHAEQSLADALRNTALGAATTPTSVSTDDASAAASQPCASSWSSS